MQQVHCLNNYINKTSSQQKIFTSQNAYPSRILLHHKKLSASIVVLNQLVSSKHHGTWSVSPMPIATANYLWQWEHRKLGWIGLAKIPKLGTLENTHASWNYQLHLKMFTWKVFGARILSCWHSWFKFSNLILCLEVHLLPYFLLHIYWCGTFKLE